jgi:thioredoxin-related protein
MRSCSRFLLILLSALTLHACSADKDGAETEAEAEPKQVEAAAEGFVWMNYAEGMAKAGAEGKYVLVDFWTSWCHWCKVMDKDTYGDEAVQARLLESFVIIKVDAESKTAQGGVEAPSGVELARQFQVSSYPTTWFTDATGKKIAPLPGFSPPEQFLVVLDFIATGAYENQNFQEFQASHN